jgi:hypothetical protein
MQSTLTPFAAFEDTLNSYISNVNTLEDISNSFLQRIGEILFGERARIFNS